MGGVKVAGGCCFQHWQQPLLPQPASSSSSSSSSCSHALSSVSIFSSISSSSSKNKSRRRSIDRGSCDRTLLAYHAADQRSPFLGTSSTKLSRRRSLDDFTDRGKRTKELVLRRAASASLDSFTDDDEADDNNDEKFIRRLQELAFKHSHDYSTSPEILPDSRNLESEDPTTSGSSASQEASSPFSCAGNSISAEPPWPAVGPEPPNWPDRDEIVPASVEMIANSVDLPLSLRIIKRRKQRVEEGFREVGKSTRCSVKMAFSSMVFIVRELQSYTLQMREVLFYENLQGILARVQEEMNASFVWLFQKIFSCTPTLMVCVMLLLANFTVYSIGHNSAAMAAVSPPPATQAVVANEQDYQQQSRRFDASSVKSLSVGKTASIGGSGNGGGKAKPVAGSTDDGGRPGGSSSSSQLRSTVVPDGISTANPETVTREGGDASVGDVTEEEEVAVEASRMQASSRDETLMDLESLQQLASPVTVELEPEDYSEYLQTELMYHQTLSQDPDNVLLLSNFAQFLNLVLHDHDRAEYYFKRAIGMKPADAEALSRYANFLWLARNDLGAAEETYLEAIAADPSNAYYAASYADFLWKTGGEDTCYPLDGDDAC